MKKRLKANYRTLSWIDHKRSHIGLAVLIAIISRGPLWGSELDKLSALAHHCKICHLAPGKANIQSSHYNLPTPIISGQNAITLEKKLVELKNHTSVMGRIAKGLTYDEIVALSRYFSHVDNHKQQSNY